MSINSKSLFCEAKYTRKWYKNSEQRARVIKTLAKRLRRAEEKAEVKKNPQRNSLTHFLHAIKYLR